MKKVLLVGAALTLGACGFGPDSPRGFSLPEGDPEKGKMLFSEYRCIDCHQVEGVKVADDHEYLLPRAVQLGGSSGRVTTYGELVTSVINPSHKLTRRYPVSITSENGERRMRNMNDVLTVADLIDIVSFLQPKYKITPYRTSEYRLYELRIPEKDSE